MLALLLLAAVTVAPARVSIMPRIHAIDAPRVAIALRRAGGETDAIVRRVIERDRPLVLDLEPGDWQLDVEAGEVWHARQFFRVHPSTNSDVSVAIWPRAMVTAAISHDAKTSPAEMLLRFEPTASLDSAAAPSGQVRCPIANGRVSCAMPAGTYRLRMRPKGFISHRFERITLAAGGTRDLGALAFRQGHSISGRVELPDGFAGKAAAVRVTAVPAGSRDDQLSPMHTQADKTGFFQLDGVSPGAYRVTAALAPSLTSSFVDVLVRGGSEAELVQPLRLARPRRIELIVAPTASPDGEAWHVKLYRREGNHLDQVTQSHATIEGVWNSPALQPGPYTAVIGTVAGDEWHREDFEVAGEDLRAAVLLTRTDISGTIKLGDRPLRAALTFSQASRSAVKAQADEDGRFRVALPKSDARRLRVTVRADAPWLQRTVTVDAPKDGEPIEIVLPDTVMMGEVVDTTGAPAENATITIARTDSLDDGLLQPRTRADGRFEVHGLVPGHTYTLVATEFLKASAPTKVHIPIDESPQPVRLVIHDAVQLEGRVVSPVAAVEGARVEARATNVPQMIIHNRRTDAAGRFASALPANTKTYEMTVIAPGFPFVIAGGALTDRPVVVRVEQTGGTLRINAPEGESPYLVHNGGTCSAATILRDWPSQQTRLDDGRHAFMLPMMEPGPYAACLVPNAKVVQFRATGGQSGGRCVTGHLPPFGSLALDLRSP